MREWTSSKGRFIDLTPVCIDGSISISTAANNGPNMPHAFISGENGGRARQVENDSKKFPERIMNPRRRWWVGVNRSFIRIPTALYGNSIGNISILAGIATHGMVLLRPASLPFVYIGGFPVSSMITFAVQ